eukprot:2834021-Rhodomonas_salina.2
MSGTEIAHCYQGSGGGAGSRAQVVPPMLCSYRCPKRCPVLTWRMLLRMYEAMSGTDVVCDVRNTDVAYATRHTLRDVRYWHSVCCYANATRVQY